MSDPDPNVSTNDPFAQLSVEEIRALLRAREAQEDDEPYAPKTPIMGGIARISPTEKAPWTGGKPKPDWSGLDPSASTAPEDTHQVRSLTGDARKSQYRRTGRSTKYKRSHDLRTFEIHVWEHLVYTGMDSIAYLPDPVDKNRMTNCVLEHSRLSVTTARTMIDPQLAKYDKYDRTNDSTATRYLLDSLDEALARELRDVCEEDDPFPIVYLQLIKLLRSISIDRFERLKTKIKSRRPEQYSGQDLTQMATDFRNDARELEVAGQYDHNLTLHILDAFLEAGGPGNEDFRYPLRVLKATLNERLLDLRYLARVDADALMVREKLSYRDVCNSVLNVYRTQMEAGRWPPAQHAKDSKAPPRTFGAVAASDVTKIASEVYALIQQVASDKPTKQESPKSSSSSSGSRNDRTRKHKGGNRPPRTSKSRSSTSTSWKYTAPPKGNPTTKLVDGLTWHWCQTCGRWSTTHGTDQHTGSKKDGASQAHANTLVLNPAAWHVDLLSPLSWSDFIPSTWEWMVGLSLLSGLMLAPLLLFLMPTPPSLWVVFAPIAWVISLFCTYACGHHHGVLKQLYKPPECAFMPNSSYRHRHPRQLGLRHRLDRRPPGFATLRRAPSNFYLDEFDRAIEFHVVTKTSRNSRANRLRNAQDLCRHRRSHLVASRVVRPSDGIGNRRRPRSYHPRRASTRSNSDTRGQVAFDRLISQSLPANLAYCPPIGSNVRPQALRTVLTSPQQAQSTLSPDQHFPVIWDSGASVAISPYKSDFIGAIQPSIKLRLQGISQGLWVSGVGEVGWSFVATDGTLRTLCVPAYYVPGAKARLLSTSSLLAQYPGEKITLLQDRLILSGLTTEGHTQSSPSIEIPLDTTSNLPVGHAYSPSATETMLGAFATTVTTVAEANMNLTPAQKELLRWHYKLGHLNFRKTQFLMRTGALAHSSSAKRLQNSAVKLTQFPLCTACQYGKQRRKSSPGLKSSIVKDRSGVLKDNKLFPGQRVSVDHFICTTRGRLLTSRGKEAPNQQYSGGAIFVDHASGYIFVAPQTHLNSHETLKAKEQFEAHCHDFGVLPQEYLSDNGSAFTSGAFREHLTRFHQVARYAGVGAHHHNGVAERSIQTVLSIARTMMLHAAIHWPDVADTQLWPLAVQHAVHLYNHVPDPSTGISPSDVFTQTRWPHNRFHELHVWGCPVYVLDKTIADGKKLPRWQPRSQRYVYVGVSGDHAATVPLVLNLATGAITPQFHVVFDDWFATVASEPSALPDFNTPEWHKLFGDTSYQYLFPDEDYTLDDISTLDDLFPHRPEVESAASTSAPPVPLSAPMSPPPSTPEVVPNELPVSQTSSGPALVPPPVSSFSSEPPAAQREDIRAHQLPSPQREQPTPQRELPSLQRESVPQTPIQSQSTPPVTALPSPTVIPPMPTPPSVQPPSPRRSTRTRRPPSRLGFDGSQGFGYGALHLPTVTLPTAYKARAVKDPDTLSYNEAMSSPDRQEWIAAAQKEIESLVAQATWVEVPITEAISKILPGTWVFRKKRSPSGEFKKFKARYCVRGDLQEAQDDTFAPVVSWSAVRLFLVMSIIMNWTTCSIDFSNAFVQASLSTPVWIHLPRGFRSSKGARTCLRLLKSLYGLATAPRLWYEHLLAALKDLGFVPCQHEPCLLIKKNMMLVLYVDDAGIAAKFPEDIDRLIADLQDKGFALTKEGSFSEFLGIKFEETTAGTIKLTQTGLIDKIISATGLQDSNPNLLPTTQLALGSDPEGPPMKEKWTYSSIVGMLLYLSTNTRVDIAFAVSQVARFSSNPKQSHATAIKTIVRYLKRTRNEGMILSPTGKLNLDLYVDADFAGLHHREPDSSSDAVRSRTGYVIFLSDCPLLWKSQLQHHISCSTLEAEYSALSYSLKTLLPLKRLLLEVVTAIGLPDSLQTTVKATVFEDNQGAICLANSQRLTNRTKYFLVKWHWFWQHASEFNIEKIASQEQRADYCTKGLPRQSFERNRFLVQRW